MTMSAQNALPAWLRSALATADDTQAWNEITRYALEQARASQKPRVLHAQLTPLDRVLAEAAWDLWERFPEQAPRTATALQDWWHAREGAGIGRAVLILDALSLRELPLLLQACARRGVTPLQVHATAAEAPTDTDQFARALGLPARSSLANDKPPATFVLGSAHVFTAVLSSPFADCVGAVKPRPDVVIWHSWLDNLIHMHNKDLAEIERAGQRELMSDGFWQFLDALRQGRRLVITADHGYAASALFATEEPDGPAKDYLMTTFKAKRNDAANGHAPHEFMPPLSIARNGEHVALGQRRWKAPGGYPHVCHGGLTLLEALVPFVELPEVQ